MNAVSPDTVLRQRITVDAVELDGEVVLYDGMFLRRLPATGALIWSLVDGHRPAGEIATIVVAGRPARDFTRVTDDVLTFLSDLLDHTILELAMLDCRTFRRPGDVGWVRDGQTVLLIDLHDGRRRALTPTGGHIWELVSEDKSAEHVVAVLRDMYPDAPSLLADVEEFLDALVQEGWLLRQEAVTG